MSILKPDSIATDSTDTTPMEMRRHWSTIKGNLKDRDLNSVRVGITASFTADPLLPYLGVQLVRRGVAPDFYLAPYNQIFQECFSADSGIKGNACDISLILWRMEDLLQSQLDLGIHDPESALEETQSEVERIVDAAIRLQLDTGGLVYLSVPPMPSVRPLGIGDLTHPAGSWALHKRVSESLIARTAGHKGIFLLDLDGVQREVGTGSGDSPKLNMLAKIPWTDQTFAAIGNKAAISVATALTVQKKCLVLDCDGTLWGGVVGEDGIEGIHISEDAPGNAYAWFQKYILSLREQGILLALCSKNNEEDVWEAINARQMPITKNHLARWKVNWESKSSNLHEIATELNIGLDSLVFIDDNPAEIAEVNANAPDVQTILLPSGTPEKYIQILEDASPFARQSLTSEDLKRPEMYQQERKREDFLSKTGSLEDFLEGLNIIVTIAKPSPHDLSRIAQLVNRTNQFNLTTHRRTEAEIADDWTDGTCRDYAVWVKDRFGEYGLTGYALVREILKSPKLDTFLMSCRVMGRGVETAMLAAVLSDLDNGQQLQAQFIKTKKNEAAKNFLSSHGFQLISDNQYVIAPDHNVKVPSFVQIASDNYTHSGS